MADSDITIVDFQAMTEAISSYTTKVTHITNIMNSLSAISKALAVGNIFTGGAATSFIAAIETTVETMNEAISALNLLIQMLQGKLDAYTAADKAASMAANAIEKAQWTEV